MNAKIVKITVPMIMLAAIIVAILYVRSCNKSSYNFETDKIIVSRLEEGSLTKIQDITDKNEIEKLTTILKNAELSDVSSNQINDSMYEYCITINSTTIISLQKNTTHGRISDEFGQGETIYLPKE